MRDNVDMEQTDQAARQERSKTRRGCIGMLAMLGFTVLFTAGIVSVLNPSRLFDAGGLLFFTNGSWEQIEGLPGGPSDVQVSSQGTVWVATTFKGGLSRFDGTGWQHYKGKDFGTEPNYLWGGFTLVGEEVWGATQDAVIHFDGHRWTAYPEALASDQPEVVVASEDEVWVLDEEGNLSHFDGERWTIASLRDDLPDAGWGGTLSHDDPTLARTPDGTLWLTQDGLWRFDGATWQEVRPAGSRLEKARLVGTTGDRLWVRDDHDLLWLPFDESNGGIYTPAALGLAQDAWVYEVAAQDDRLWVATSEGVLTFDGDAWQSLPLPGDLGRATDVTLAPDGTVWAVAEKTPSIARLLLQFAPLLALGIGTLGFIFVWMGRGLKRQVQSATRQGEVVHRTVPGMPEREKTPAAEKSLKWLPLYPLLLIVLTIIFVYLAMPLFRALERFLESVWPGAPQWVETFLFVMAVGLIVPVLKWLITTLRGSRDENSAPFWREMLKGARSLIFFFVIFIAFEIVFEPLLDWLASVIGNPMLLIPVVLIGGLSLVTLPGFMLFAGPAYWILAALRKADYAGALRRVRFMRRLRPRKADLIFLEGTVHLFAGEYREAEERLRESLAEGQKSDTPTQSSALENLGCVLTEQGRYEEAIKTLEGAIDLDPDGSGPYSSLAEVYLRQGLRPDRALELLERALDYKGKSVARSRLDGHRWGEFLSNKAWALALQRRHAEAEEALEQAFEKVGRKFKPGLADVHYKAGHVLRLRGDKAAAAEHWQQARQIDPQGSAGRCAARAMREMG